MTPRRVLLACDIDSQIFGSLPLALAFKARGWDVTFAIESKSALSGQILNRLNRDFAIVECPLGTLPADDMVLEHEAIGVFATGSRLAFFRHLTEIAARAKGRPRPALFCGFNGLVFEKFEEGLAWRFGYDVIGLNGPRDVDAFQDFVRSTEFEDQPIAIVGLRRKTVTPRAPEPATSDPAAPADQSPGGDPSPGASRDEDASAVPPPAQPEASQLEPAEPEPAQPEPEPEPVPDRKLFVFAEQVVVPRTKRDRERLVAILVRLAQVSPGWTVVLKARTRPDEITFHAQTDHISKLVNKAGARPPNFKLSYEPLDDLLARADLFATVSSTALFDAFDHGVPSIVATDFGLRNADGAHVFFASGLLAPLGELTSLDAAPTRAPDPRWLERMGYHERYSPHALVDWLEDFDPARPMPTAFVSFATAAKSAFGPATAATMCARHGDIEASLLAVPTTDTLVKRGQALGTLAMLATNRAAKGRPAPSRKPAGQAEDPAPPRLSLNRLYRQIRGKFGAPSN